MADFWPAAKRLTAAEQQRLQADAQARREASEAALTHYELLVEQQGGVGAQVALAAYKAAVEDYREAKLAGDMSAAAKFLKIAADQGERLQRQLEMVLTRRDRREAGEKLIDKVAPATIVMNPVKPGD